jgi:hypothetical protein
VAQEWVRTNMLLSLLDGLDEVAAEYRAGCVEAINTYRQIQAGLLPLAVCSRVADYENLTVKLRLAGAVVVQPLTINQITSYLEKGGASLEAVRAVLQADQMLWELLDNPLMLSIVALAYKNMSTAKLQAAETLEARRYQLFDDYIEAMFRRRSKETLYTPAQTVSWLSWLACQTQQQGQTVFLIEQMQPGLLGPRLYRLYGLAIRLVMSLCTGLVFGVLVGWFSGIGYALVFGLSTLIALATVWELTGRPVIHVAGGLAVAPAEGVVCGIVRGLMTGGWLSGLAAGIPTAVIIGLAAGLIRVDRIDVAEITRAFGDLCAMQLPGAVCSASESCWRSRQRRILASVSPMAGMLGMSAPFSTRLTMDSAFYWLRLLYLAASPVYNTSCCVSCFFGPAMSPGIMRAFSTTVPTAFSCAKLVVGISLHIACSWSISPRCTTLPETRDFTRI